MHEGQVMAVHVVKRGKFCVTDSSRSPLQMRWQQAQPHGRARKPCEGHTVSVVDTSLFVLFGKHEDDCGNVVCPPLQMLDVETMSLSHPHIEPGPDGRTTIPGDREGHSAAVIGSKIHVFGGTWTDDDDSTITSAHVTPGGPNEQ